ncbi:hypothetical protein ACFFHB_09715, partial [Chromohalobacter canadensis]
YNHHIPQKALHHQSPIAMMKEWQTKRPELFTKRVVNHTGPDNYSQKSDQRLKQLTNKSSRFATRGSFGLQ